MVDVNSLGISKAYKMITEHGKNQNTHTMETYTGNLSVHGMS